MSQVNCLRAGCRDVFHAFLVENADYEGFFEIPKLDYLCEKPLRAIARWLQDNGVKVIVNVRWGDRRTYSISCCGVPKNGAIAIGSHGTLKQREDREFFVNGLKYVVDNIHPKIIVVYGAAPDSIFAKYKEQGILVLQFDSSFAISRRKEDA